MWPGVTACDSWASHVTAQVLPSYSSPQTGVLCRHHQVRGIRLPQQGEDALTGWEGSLVAALVDGETLGDH